MNHTMSTENKPKLLDEVRAIMRVRRYSIHTERSYCDWIKRYINFHKMRSRDDLENGEKKIELFLTHLAIDTNISASTQRLALNALIFLYKHVLGKPLNEKIDAVRAPEKKNIPVVMTIDEVTKIIKLMESTPKLIVQLLYGTGLRIIEALRLRIFDINFEYKSVTVHAGKGNKARVSTFAEKLVEPLQTHIKYVKQLHEEDLRNGYGRVYLPDAL
ncbi:Integron integrase (fragment) [Desulfamplus magnetovallimortis]|uniref:Integron integrase n=1 Tax=Desulfamplus magnetovallimortis TaxID=1246637 RepID=A0A1W1H9S6_9BACT